MKKTLVIQHEEDVTAGSTLEWFRLRDSAFELVFASQADFSKLNNFDQVVICGGSMNVDEEEKFPWLSREKEFIRRAISERKKIVGLCLGGQLVSEALGAQVGPMSAAKDVWEVGWHDVQFSGSDSVLKALHWHRYQFSLPPGARHYASSSLCANQAYLFSDHIAAFQFHPEVDETWVELALEGYEPPAKGSVQDESAIRALSPESLAASRKWYFDFLDRFLETR